MDETLRLRFSKTGRAIYISHLDLMRTMQRAFLRADMPLRYSEGFNPHALISILLPLSVGAASECELMNFRLLAETPLSEIPQRLTAVMPEGICAIEAYTAQRKAKELKWLRVEGVFEYDSLPPESAARALSEFYASGSIVVEKKTKRGMGEADIAPAIKSINFKAADRAVNVRALISAQEPTLNPELLSSAVKQKLPEFSPDFASFTRKEVYDSEMEIFR